LANARNRTPRFWGSHETAEADEVVFEGITRVSSDVPVCWGVIEDREARPGWAKGLTVLDAKSTARRLEPTTRVGNVDVKADRWIRIRVPSDPSMLRLINRRRHDSDSGFDAKQASHVGQRG